MFCRTDNPRLIAFCKRTPDCSNVILVVVNLDPEHVQHGWIKVPLDLTDPAQRDAYEVTDLLDGARYTWCAELTYVRLDPRLSPAHILRLPVATPAIVTRTSDALAQVLSRQRWFAGKARTIVGARLVDWSPLPPTDERLMPAIAEVQYIDGGTERYFLPVALVKDADAAASSAGGMIVRTGDIAVTDALASDEACHALLSVMLDQRPITMRDGTARATVYRHSMAVRRWTVARSTAEQSNSCVAFGNRYVLKLLRRLEPGRNPELEISRFLSARGFACIPPLVASLEYERTGEEPSSLALLHRFVVNDGTAWDHAIDGVRHFMLHETPSTQTPERIAFLQSAATLGQRTAELHLALGADDRDPRSRRKRSVQTISPRS